MARKIDTGSEPSAHTAIQAMIGRGRITANRDHKRVAVVCDLANDQLTIVDLANGGPDESECIRIFEPATAVRTVLFREGDSKPVEIPLSAEESQYC